MGRHVYRFLLFAQLAIALASCTFAQPPRTMPPIIREIAFRGIEHVSPILTDQLAQVMKSKVGEPYNLETLVADKQALHDLGWFATVETSTLPVEGGIRLIFFVVENVPVLSVEHPTLAHASLEQRLQVDELLKALVGQPYSEKMTNAATEKALALGIFYNVYYKRENVEGGIRLTFTLVENPAIAAITLTGTGPLTAEHLQKVITSKPGQVMNQNAIGNDAAAIRKAYAEAGYTMAQVTGLNMSPECELTIDILVPTISEIRITGNVKIPEATIRQQLTFKVGDYYNENAIKESLAKISKLPLVLEARAIPEPGKEKDTLCITINIRERNN